MKALVYTKPNAVEFQDYPSPTLADDEVVLRIEAVGICGSDMHAYHGHDPRRQPGLVLGHEFSGVVTQSRSSLFTPGTRVTGNPLITCTECKYCRQGRNNLCENRTMVGMTRPGAFAEMMSIPAGSLIPIPDRMAYDIAALTEPAATAFHAINLSKLSLHCDLREASVLVIGGGAIGMFSALLLRSNGVSRLRVAEVNENRRNSIAAQIDCCVFDPRSEPVTSNEFDLVVDCVGSVITRKTSLEAVSPGGVVMHIGLQDWASEIDMRKLTLAEITLLGTYTYTTDDLKQTVAMLDAGVFGDCRWIEKRPLRDGAQAFSDLHYGRAASAKIVLEPYG